MNHGLRIAQISVFIIAIYSGLGTSFAALNITPAIDFYEFVAGRQFTKAETKTLRRLIRTVERDDPDGVADSIKNTKKSLSQIAKVRKGRPKLLVRDRMTAGVYCRLKNDVDPSAETFSRIIFKTNPVFASDCANNEQPVIASRRSLIWIERIIILATSRRLNKDERKSVRAELEKEARDLPEFTLDAVRQTMDGWSELNNGGFIRRAITSQKGIASMYCSVIASSGKDSAEWWFRQDRIISANCDSKMVISSRKAKAFLGIYNFVSKLGGHPSASKAQRRKFYREVRQQGEEFDPNQGIGYYLDNAIVVELALRKHWSRLTKVDQSRIRAQFKRRLANKQHPVDIAFDINKVESSACNAGDNIFCQKPVSYLQLLSNAYNIGHLYDIARSYL